MDIFNEEIYKVAEFLFLCGERLLETESFILELTRRKNISFEEDWRKKLSEFLDEGKNHNFKLDILDKRSNQTLNLNQLNPLNVRNLYMELAAHLDLEDQYSVQQTEDPLIYTFSQVKTEEERLILK